MKVEASRMESEWSKAQEVVISVNLMKAARQQLRFLHAVDTVGNLYDGPALDRAICRYKYCWIPLLSKHVESPVTTEPLVVPLDCEWIWHCHRLSPVQYKADCEMIFGKTLGSVNILSTTQVTCTKESETVWNNMYPTESYYTQLDGRFLMNNFETQRSTNYDLKAAAKRQSSFLHKVSKSITQDDTFLEEAVASYKGFLHLLKLVRKSPMKYPCVPTIPIDLIWHSHQLHPLSYCEDLNTILGMIADHDDRYTSNNSNLENGFIQTSKVWEETFGNQYEMAKRTPKASGALVVEHGNCGLVENGSCGLVEHGSCGLIDYDVLENSQANCWGCIVICTSGVTEDSQA